MTDTERYHRRRRGVVRGMITRLTIRFVDLKSKTELPDTLSHTRQMAQRLRSLDSKFKQHHFAIVDLIERDEDHRTEGPGRFTKIKYLTSQWP